MIESLLLKNFKCFREHTVPLGGLTVLAGPNGAGKSSLVQAIMALWQRTLDGQTSPWRGSLVNLGTHSDVLHDDAKDDVVRVEARFADNDHVWLEVHPRAPDEWQCSPGAERQLQGSLYYISADRLGPRDTLPYVERQHLPATPLGTRGEHVLGYISQKGHMRVAEALRHPDEPKHTLEKQANAWLSTVSLGANLEVKVIPEADGAVASYRFSRMDGWSRAFRARNVGDGISYALPPIIALLTPKQNGHDAADHLVIIENPEAHLHPGGQMALVELAARAVAHGSQVILETHSDHVLNGVRLAVHGGILTPAQVAINYFEREGLDVRVSTPTLNQNGRLDYWPEGFFDQHERNLSRLIGAPATPVSRP